VNLWKIDDETWEIDPGPTQEPFTVTVDYRFKTVPEGTGLLLERVYWQLKLENGQPANLDQETEYKLCSAVEMDYLNYIAGHEPSDWY
jgi:hypothetical protein